MILTQFADASPVASQVAGSMEQIDMKRWSMSLVIGLLLIVVQPTADEGMWTFDNPPRAQWRDRYGFEPSPAWLDHLRLSSVRLNDGGSASFVSGDGLLITNQHVAGGQLQKVSAADRDFVRDGFYAKSRAEEIECFRISKPTCWCRPEDVTRRVEDASQSAESDADAAARAGPRSPASKRNRSKAPGFVPTSSACIAAASPGCTVTSGTPISAWCSHPKSRWRSSEAITDNFTYPHHDLDVAFLRVYKNGQPARTADYLRWSASGPSEGEFVVLSGHPGSTDRLLTLSQITYQRDVGNPLQRKIWETRRDGLGSYAKRGPEEARQAGETIRLLDNALKRLVGQQRGLENPRIFGAKVEEERALRGKVEANPEWQRGYGDAWTKIDAMYRNCRRRRPVWRSRR